MSHAVHRLRAPATLARRSWTAAFRLPQAEWAALPLGERLRVVRGIRHGIAAHAAGLARAAGGGAARREAEVLSSEVVPLADACRFLEREAPRLLATRRLGAEGRPAWLTGVTAEVRREPLGIVLVIAPATYPLFLPGVQTLQALAAGNAVLWKPGPGGSDAAGAFATLAASAGLPTGLLAILGEEPEAAREAIAAAPDKVLLTGSADTGREVLAELAGRLVPATMELSGCDALFVLPGADLDRVARAVRFGLTLNGGATCIAPRRILVPMAMARDLETRIGLPLGPETATLTAFQTIDEALAEAARSPYALGASIFGPEAEATALAARVRAGVVVINDVIVPTADPRLPFGGRGESGFGVTRGAEGLLELTVPKVIATRRSRRLFHLEAADPGDADLFRAYLELTHAGSLKARLRGGLDLARALIRRGRP
ncbi:MAG TPA: aldehyde dehydrogenase family protein [Thermoanaerobaculia bacterium]|jgi:acyl-CoA reductase-like NAD-dependent aldehyde dehydrogenase|nr:aldehyde dehydrogenase family protein [Thermoanaerobaculia bacterium]